MTPRQEFDSLEGKTVLVTGGARGIGKGIAERCLKEGARVVITNMNAEVGQSTQKELSALGNIRAATCDATSQEQMEALAEDIWAKEGPVDLVFSNAGKGGSHRVLESSLAESRDIMATNYESSLLTAQVFVPRMLASGNPGHVMFTGSEHSLSLPQGNEDLGFAFYGASKHAMLIMAEWLRHDLKDTNVSVSLLMPGPVLTEGVAGAFAVLDEDPDNPQIREQFSREVEQLLRERIITTGECAEIALKGLRKGLFFIPTQPHLSLDVDRRYNELAEAFKVLLES
ncbi:MAG: SDR family oxidoreductase [Pseudomonadales bacterium]|nr:SDR family oxidoreductase [Pseudomonadales bacterium]